MCLANKPTELIIGLAALPTIAAKIVIYFDSFIGVYAPILLSDCISLMYQTNHGLAISRLGSDTKIASSGLVIVILCGAVLTPIQGLVSDAPESNNDAF